MDDSRLTPYPHLSWLAYGLTIQPPRVFFLHEYTAATHRLMVTEEGDADLAWGTGADHVACHVTGGTLGFFPCDSAPHTLSITAAAGFLGHELLVPSSHLESVCEAEGAEPMVESRVFPAFRDTLLLACVHRLLAGSARGHLAEDVGTEIAARQVILRLAAVTGSRPPHLNGSRTRASLCRLSWRRSWNAWTPTLVGKHRWRKSAAASACHRATLPGSFSNRPA